MSKVAFSLLDLGVCWLIISGPSGPATTHTHELRNALMYAGASAVALLVAIVVGRYA